VRYLSTVVLFAILASACQRADPPASQLKYPAAAKGDVVDDYGGTKVPDPYRWMEALDSKEVADWVAASNAVTDPYLMKLPLREPFNKRLTELWNYPRVSVPVVKAGELFYARNTGLQRQSPIFVRAGVAAPPRLVIDPNVISEDGSLSLSQWTPSPDGKLLAYGLAEGGADWNTIRVRDIGSGKDLTDEVRWMRFSNISWTNDNKGFYYSRYPEPQRRERIVPPLPTIQSRPGLFANRWRSGASISILRQVVPPSTVSKSTPGSAWLASPTAQPVRSSRKKRSRTKLPA